MAVSTGFKQQCPSCEALVAVKDAGMIGKKIDCPKCKYRFVVEGPATGEEKPQAQKTPAKEAKKAKGTKADGEAAAAVSTADTKEAIQAKAKTKVNGKAGKQPAANGEPASPPAAAGAPAPASEEGQSTPAAEAAKPKKRFTLPKNKKLVLGLSLAGVGVVILVVAGIVIMSRKPSSPGNKGGQVTFNTGNTGPGSNGSVTQNITNTNLNVKKADKNSKDKKQTKPGKVEKGKDTKPVEGEPMGEEIALSGGGPGFTNLLPNDSQHVVHVFFNNVFGSRSVLPEMLFGSTAGFAREEFRKRLGFSPLHVDDLVRAENFTAPWTYTVVHTARAVDEKELIRALDLEAQTPIGGQAYYKIRKSLAWLNELGQLGFGAPEHLRWAGERKSDRPLYVRVHEPQTIIFADQDPLTSFLRSGSKFTWQTERRGSPSSPADKSAPPPDKRPKLPPGLPGSSSLDSGERGYELLQEPMPTGNPKPGAGSPKPQAGKPPKGKPDKGGKKPEKAPEMPMPAPEIAPAAGLGGTEYMTIPPELKATLVRLEARPKGSKERVLFSTATDMKAARILSKDLDSFGQSLWRFRQFWDVTHLVRSRSLVLYLGVSLHQKETRAFRYKSEVTCASAADARELEMDLFERGGPQVVKFVDRMLGHHRVEVDFQPPSAPAPTAGVPNPGAPRVPPGFVNPGGSPPPGGFPFPPGDFKGKFPGKGGGMMPGMPGGPGVPGGGFPGFPGNQPGGQPGFPGGKPPGFPGGKMPGLPGGTFPSPGGFPPGGGQPGFPGNMPGGPQLGTQTSPEAAAADDGELKNSRLRVRGDEERVTFTLDLVLDAGAYNQLYSLAVLWIEGLKDQMELAEGKSFRHKLALAGRDLGVNGLSERRVLPGTYPPGAFPRPVKFRSGRDPSQRVSWLAGLLPYMGHGELYGRINFDDSWRDPSNWLSGRTLVPEFLDPAYPLSTRRVVHPELPFEPAATHFIGIAGVGLDAADYPADDPTYEFKRGILGYDGSRSLKDVQRGLGNTILLLQVPHDGPAGVTPWLAGGGSTLRGVPEKNAIAPFVLSTDKDGKPITYQGKRGTYAGMADASVRFIDAKISDDVFKAMCTVKSRTNDKGAVDDWAPLVLPPTPQVRETPPVSAETTPDKAVPAKKDQKPAKTK